MERKKITLAVTGLNNTDVPGPGVPFIRGLKESGEFDIRVTGLVYETLEPGIYMENLCDRIFLIPEPVSDPAGFIGRIEEIHQQEQIDVLVPNIDPELFLLIQHEEKLSELGIHTFLPTLEQFHDRQKNRLSEFGKKYGINVPDSIILQNLGQITGIEERFDYPVMVKGKNYDAYPAYNKEQVRQIFLKISGQWGLPVIIQEHVKGTAINVAALGDGNGNTMAAVPMRKQYVTEKGKAWSGITIADEKIMDLTRSLIRKTSWRGGMELELVKTGSGKLYLIEINPRVPTWVYLAVGAGQNMPEALVRMALGEEIAPMEHYKPGKVFVRYSYDMIIDTEKLAAITMNREI